MIIICENKCKLKLGDEYKTYPTNSVELKELEDTYILSDIKFSLNDGIRITMSNKKYKNLLLHIINPFFTENSIISSCYIFVLNN